MSDLGQVLRSMTSHFDNSLLHLLKQHYIAYCETSSMFKELLDYFENVFGF